MPYPCWICNDDIQRGFIGINTCAVDMLYALPIDKGEISLIAHNSNYDCRFILESLQNAKPILKRCRFLQIKATYYNPKSRKKINIIVKDSYKLIPMALREFGKCFKLDASEEVMPYNVYTYQNVPMGACSIQSALGIITDDGKHHFSNNLEKWDCILGKGMENQMFDLLTCSSIYCKVGCKVLMDGYDVFRQWMSEHTELDVDHYITIQSMASSFMLKSSCYGAVYQIPGEMQQFIAKCVVGGRVMTNPNKRYHVKKDIADFDACSLSPSAMYFTEGFLKGLPDILSGTSYELLKQQDGNFVRVVITELNAHLDFPLTSKLNVENGVRDVINEMGNGIVCIGKVGLKEIVGYHKAEFGIIDGYYDNEGRNNTINHVINDLYDLRNKLKQDGY